MRSGDIVVCINVDDLKGPAITLHKSYGVIQDMEFINSTGYIMINNDEGKRTRYIASRFIPLSQWRSKRLNEILK